MGLHDGLEGGIWFKVFAGDGVQLVPADVRRVAKSGRNTVLCGEGNVPAIVTTEHVLSAMVGLGITDAVIELQGPEIPIVDGSADPFARLMQQGELLEMSMGVKPLVISRVHRLEFSATQWIELSPPDRSAEHSCTYSYHLRYDLGDAVTGPYVLEQEARFVLDCEQPSARDYLEHVAPARTFCTLAEARQWKAAGLFGHVKPGDVLVLASPGQMQADPTIAEMCQRRMEDEPARHKLLDLMGDLALVGRPIIGKIVAHCTGHEHNHAAARVLRQMSEDSFG
jgi:UDP-3-O-acyl-N-acetylglucosamine deacetylase